MINIRNFCIIAHVDHGKSTLADRFLELTKTVDAREMKPQYLDQLDLERERGITIKMTPVRMLCDLKELISFSVGEEDRRLNFSAENEESDKYVLNLIDTPGHSDFTYEVSRALAAVEGAILLVDSTQGIQAQTLANFELAKKAGLKIIGVVNKIDLNPSNLEEIVFDIASLLDCKKEEIYCVSAKTGKNVDKVLRAIIEQIPSPIIKNISTKSKKEAEGIGQALVFDSFYDDHKGIVAFVRVFGGKFKANEELLLLAGKTKFRAKEVGYFSPALEPSDFLGAGDIGYIATGIKSPDKLKIGDTILALSGLTTSKKNRKIFDFESDIYRNFALPGFREPKPVVFVSLYPKEEDRYDDLKSALYRLKLNDSSFVFESEMNEVLGRGFRCGFLGRLHFEIVTERLKREFGLETTSSFPTVEYRVRQKNNWQLIRSPENFPDNYDEAREPMVNLEILTPKEYLGEVLNLRRYFRLSNTTTTNFGKDYIIIKAILPLTDLISNFDDHLKSVSRGYASFSYEMAGDSPADLVKLEILVAGEIVPGLTRIVTKEEAEIVGRQTVERLKNLLPRQQFAQAIQARAFGRIIAREDIPALKKLLGYFGKTGGDRTRKLKLWEKQKRGKEKLKKMGKVKISPEVFREILKK